MVVERLKRGAAEVSEALVSKEVSAPTTVTERLAAKAKADALVTKALVTSQVTADTKINEKVTIEAEATVQARACWQMLVFGLRSTGSNPSSWPACTAKPAHRIAATTP